MLEQVSQVTMIQSIEELSDIHVENPLNPQCHRLTMKILQSLVSRAAATEAIRAGKKIPAVDGFQNHHDRPLQDLVFDGRYADRAGLGFRAPFRNTHTSHRGCSVSARLGPRQKRVEVFLQARFVVVPGLTIDAGRPVLTGFPERFTQPVDVQVVVQGRERHLRRLGRKQSDSSLFR